jgi:hypothetical protein
MGIHCEKRQFALDLNPNICKITFQLKLMIQRYQVLCINGLNNLFEGKLSFIGGKNPLGETWILSTERAIQEIESGKLEFYVNWEKESFEIEILLDSDNQKSLGTPKAPNQENLLFQLPQCAFY